MNSRTRTSLSIFAAISAAIALSGCGGSGTFSPAITLNGPPPEIIVTVSPQGPTVFTGGQQPFTATVTGTSNTAVRWSVSSTTNQGNLGTITAGGLYTAPDVVPPPVSKFHPGKRLPPGDATAMIVITATSLADPAATATSVITLEQTAVTVTVSPSNPTVTTGSTKQFTATVTGVSNTNVTWSISSNVTGDIGSISTTGLYTAPENIPSKRGAGKQAPGNTTATVTITATSVAVPNVSGSTIATLEVG